MDNCTVAELQKERADSSPIILIDVRTAEELAIARIEGAHHIPLNALPMRVNDLDDWRDTNIVCMCHHGMRSAQAQQILVSHGFTRVRNLTGGIQAWATEIDSDMAQY